MEILQKGDAILKELLNEGIEFENLISQHPQIPSPQEELQCSICYNIFNIPIVLPDCQHMFCKQCLDQWIIKSSTTCPLCRKDLKTFQDIGSNEIKYSLIDYNTMYLIDQISVNCITNNCKWNGQLKNLNTHLEEQCRLVKCGNSKCSQQMQKSDLDSHMDQVCAYRQIKCPQYCGEIFDAIELIAHLNECIYSYSKCRTCDGIIQNCSYAQHQCFSQKIEQCKNSEWGCQEQALHTCKFEFIQCTSCFQQFMRKDISIHKQQCNKRQLIDLIAEFKKLVINNLGPVKHNQILLEQSKQQCAQESLLITNVLMDVNKDQLAKIFLQFGPIYNMIEFLNLQKQSSEQNKKVAVRFYHKDQAKLCRQYLSSNAVFNKSINSKICIEYLKTKQELLETVLYVDNLDTQDKSKIMLQFKQFHIQNAQFLTSVTNWKKGKMTFQFLLFFPNQDLTQQCLKQFPNMKPYNPQLFDQSPKYCLNPYE